jgi:methylamine dehydrogenase heavy chain
MVSSVRWLAVLRLAVLLPGTLAAAAPPAPLPAERISVQQLPPSSHHWVYVFDDAFANEIDMRVHVYDGDHYRRLGQIDAGYYSSFNLSPDGATTAVAGEIVLPPKRAQTLPTPFNLAYSGDAHLLYVAYVTPAASFGVLDPVKKTVLGEIDTAGCVLVIPSGTYRVSSICESGRLLTVALDAAGKETGRAMSEPFFDADRDPVFVQGIPTNKGYAFLSFLGKVHEIDFSGEQPRIGAPWSLLTTAEQGVWRPGAQQVGAIHVGLGRLYVPMHQGGEGTHKDGGTEVWVFDLASHKRVARFPMATHGLTRVIAVQISQDDAPLLFAATDSAQLAVIDPRDGHIRHIEKHFGQTPWQMLNP